MGAPVILGKAAFFLVPLLLWAVAAFATKQKGLGVRAFAFIAGSDNRLSLAKLQALAWTLVIFGSFAAAMISHNPIASGGEAEQKQAVADADKATQKAEELKKEAEKALTAAKNARSEMADADEANKDAQKIIETAKDEEKTKAKTAADKAEEALKLKKKESEKKNQAETGAITAAKQAEQAAREANLKAKSYNWVEIPAALLMLAGIAIGSGVFSSLISALNGEDKTARVTEVKSIMATEVKSKCSDAKPTSNENVLLLTGIDFGASGTAKLGRAGNGEEVVPSLCWNSTNIVLDVNAAKLDGLECLLLETSNGKLWYPLDKDLRLGEQRSSYEFADLFRNDKNPSNLDLMKFQMFGWTVIAILIYSYLFLTDLRADMDSLPVVPQSIVILTGLSQAGYLTGKGVSNVSPNERR
ncbi:MAG: hypothetical protein HYR56_10970 [Acidobacteria bacterium]|nr:hypothetical protein [Acidobacteriota bacterium]MBI3428304.1 hypothetical protein [Acidobacteriota bacterium]